MCPVRSSQADAVMWWLLVVVNCDPYPTASVEQSPAAELREDISGTWAFLEGLRQEERVLSMSDFLARVLTCAAARRGDGAECGGGSTEGEGCAVLVLLHIHAALAQGVGKGDEEPFLPRLQGVLRSIRLGTDLDGSQRHSSADCRPGIMRSLVVGWASADVSAGEEIGFEGGCAM
jgi:hypothetical protein